MSIVWAQEHFNHSVESFTGISALILWCDINGHVMVCILFVWQECSAVCMQCRAPHSMSDVAIIFCFKKYPIFLFNITFNHIKYILKKWQFGIRKQRWRSPGIDLLHCPNYFFSCCGVISQIWWSIGHKRCVFKWGSFRWLKSPWKPISSLRVGD